MTDVLDQAEWYRKHAAITGRGHYLASDVALRRQNWFGIPVVVTTVIVGTSIFATISTDPAIGWKIAAGLITLAAAILSALQTFFKFSEVAERHKASGASYGALRRRFDLFLLRHGGGDEVHRELALDELEAIYRATLHIS